MRVLFTTQSDSIRMFDALRAVIHQRVGIEAAGFTVADSQAYSRWLRDAPDFESQGHILLKEWDVTAQRQGTPDLAKLARYEIQLGGEAGLFGALVSDRRLFMGPDCTYSQDYRRRFTDDELLCILQQGLESTERLFDELEPDLLVGFICVTMMEYLAYLFAKAKGVRIMNLRPTRIKDRVTFSPILNDPDAGLMSVYTRILSGGGTPYADEAKKHVNHVRNQHGRYEGVIRPSDKPALIVNAEGKSPLKGAVRVLGNYLQYLRSAERTDNHVADPLRALFFATVVNPLRARKADSFLSRYYVTAESLKSVRFAFYPLHTEPEVSLLVYGRPFVNQIEVIRTLAMSLPVDMMLVVKEHPWMVGKRSLGAYRNLLNIPKVLFVRPSTEARSLIEEAELVAVVTGSIALEAAILGKPVVTFGDCPYNALPNTMVRRCADLRRLPSLLRDLLASHCCDDAALEAYVAAVLENSASVNLYSVLLNKKGVHSERKSEYRQEIERLAVYLIAIIKEEQIHSHFSIGTACW